MTTGRIDLPLLSLDEGDGDALVEHVQKHVSFLHLSAGPYIITIERLVECTCPDWWLDRYGNYARPLRRRSLRIRHHPDCDKIADSHE